MEGYLKYAISGNSIMSYIESVNLVVDKVNKVNGKSKFLIAMDIIMCTFKYSASPNDYLMFQFYCLDNNKRSTYVTHGMSKKLISQYNDNNYRWMFNDKIEFAKIFKDYFGRDWIRLKDMDFESFEKFVQNKERIIVKPIDSSQGQGVEKIEMDDFANCKDIYIYLKEKYSNDGIIEDWITQHKELSKLYDRSVNTIRVITVLKDQECHILGAFLTIGNGGDISNASLNDLVAPIDINSGVIHFPAEDLAGGVYSKHPITGISIVGFQIPYWDKVVKLLESACRVVPEVCYVGWDIAITEEGPLLIEGNTSPGYKFFQIPNHLPDRIGKKAIYGRFV